MASHPVPATQNSPVVVVPATQQVAPATIPSPVVIQPEIVQPVGAFLSIDQHPEAFGPAMLRVNKSPDGKIIARLYSDNPADDLASKQPVNSFDFEMVLPDISDLTQLSQAIWTSRSLSSDRQDTPYGIVLADRKEVLQPKDASVSFKGQAPHMQVLMAGEFWLYRTSPDGVGMPPQIVRVMGILQATVPEK